MKKLLFFFCCLALLAGGCSKQAAKLPTILGSGNVTIPEYQINSPADGKILGFILEPNERIGQNQPLFAIEQPELDKAVESAATEAARAEAELINLQKGSSEQAIAAAGYSLQSAQSSYQSAKDNYAKMSFLYAQNAIARVKVEQAQNALVAAEANLDAAQSHYNRMTEKASPDEIAKQQAITDKAHEYYKKLEEEQQANEAQSPCTGIVTEKLLKTGDTAAKGQHVLTIKATEQRQVTLKLLPQQAEALQPGQAVQAEAKTIKKTFPGTITAINGDMITITIEDKLESLTVEAEVTITLKN